VENPEGNRSLGRSICGWIILKWLLDRMWLYELHWSGMDGDQYRSLVDTVMTLRVP
jgi:hypothetical protein